MLGRRNFVYKRSNGALHNIFNRASLPQGTSSAAPSEAQTPASIAVPSTTAVVSQTTPAAASSSAPTPSSSDASSAASTPTPSVVLSVSLTGSAASSAISSLSVAHASTASSHAVLSPTTTANALTVATQAVPSVSYTPTSTISQSASATPSSTSSGGTSTSAIVGGVAGTLAGIAILGLLLMWCMRRQRNRDIDDFDAQAFKRQSAILVDDPTEPPQSYNPRPPTMIERHNASPALAAQSGYGQNFYGSYGGYGQQPPYPPEMAQPPQQPYAPAGYEGYDDPHQQLARQPSNVGYADFGSQQQLARQPSNAQYLTRQPSAAAPYAAPTAPPTSFGGDAHYLDLNRSSVSPYQAAQYADISRQLGATDPNQHLPQVPHGSDDLLDNPLPSPFDDHAAPNPVQGSAPALHQRPSVHFEEGDAYGGI